MSRNGKTSTYGWGAPLPICRSQIAPVGYSRKFYTGRLPLGVEPISFLYTIYWQKSYPFRIPFNDKWQYPSHKFSLELCIPFNYCKRTFFLNGLKIELKSKRLLQRLITQRQKGWGIQYFEWPIPGIGKPGEDWYWPGRRLWGVLRKDNCFVREWKRQKGLEKLCEIYKSLYKLSVLYNATINTLTKRFHRDKKVFIPVKLVGCLFIIYYIKHLWK